MGDSLKGKEGLFVAAYLRSRNAPAAAQEAGYSPRTANRLLNTHTIAEAIRAAGEAVQAETESAGVSPASLLREAEQALQAAQESGNVPAQIAAIQLKARLTGLLDAPEPPADSKAPEAVNVADLARSIMAVLAKAEVETGLRFGIAGPGEAMLKIPRSIADAGLVTGADATVVDLVNKLSEMPPKPNAGGAA